MRFQMTSTWGTYDGLGQTYATLSHAGLMPEGGEPEMCDNEKAAWAAYWATFSDFCAAEKAAGVEWRVAPHVEERGGKFWIRSRLSVIEREAA